MDDRTTHRLREADDRDDLDDARALAQARRRLLGRGRALALRRYELGARLGAGGGGAVYRARDPELEREVAIKVVRSTSGGERAAAAAARLTREARVLARLSHPNIVTIFDVGVLPGEDGVFVVMELVEGGDLDRWLEEERPWDQVLGRFLAAGEGLAAAHAAGIVHRDFKPANVLCDARGRVLVADFGLARAAEQPVPSTFEEPEGPGASDRITKHGVAVGTPRFMAPEQHYGEPVDARADQFAFCAALYEALCGVPPFAGETLVEVADAKRQGQITEPRRTDAPSYLRELLVRGMAAPPDERHPDMPTLLDALRTPPRRPGRIVLASVVGLVGVGAMLWAAEPRPDPCARAGRELVSAWSEEAKDASRRAFEATEVAYASTSFEEASAGLDDYVARLQDEANAACRREDVGRRSCLAGAGAALDEVVGVWREADASAVEAAARAVGKLPSPSACRRGAVEGWPEELARLRGRIAAKDALGDVRGLQMVDEALARPDAQAPEIRAELLRLRGRLLGTAERTDEAIEVLEEAYYLAMKAPHVAVAADSAADLVVATGAWGTSIEDGLEWGRHALALADRADDDGRRARALDNTGQLLNMVGRHEEALDHHRRARDLMARVHGGDSVQVAISDTGLGNAAQSLGRLDEAEQAFRRALAVFGREGEDHPRAAKVLGNLANVALDRGDPARAAELQRRAIEALGRAYHPEHHTVGVARNGLAIAQWELGARDEALRNYERALEIFERSIGPDHLDTAQTAFNIAMRYAELGDVDSARRNLRQAADVFRREDRSLAMLSATLVVWAQLEWEVDDLDAAWALAKEAEERLTAQAEPDPAELGRARLMLAGLCVARDDYRPAVAYAEDALELIRRGGRAEDIATIEAWMEDNREWLDQGR